MSNSILAVVVTYNRLSLLKRCYLALKEQTFKGFDILVVDNGSTDGTSEWLDMINDDSLSIIHQDNCGGAGGFYAGMKYGFEQNYQYIWMMDDDGVPDSNQLDRLFHYAESTKTLLLNALVCDVDYPDVLAFNPSRKVDGLGKVLIGEEFRPFNGTFIQRRLIDRIGLIKREMFIWGDEVEYTLRARKAGVIPVVLSEAIHYHPRNKAIFDRVLPPLVNSTVIIKPEKFSKYYYRNLGYNNHSYSNWHVVIGNNLSYIIYFLRKGKVLELLKFLRFYWCGFFNRY